MQNNRGARAPLRVAAKQSTLSLLLRKPRYAAFRPDGPALTRRNESDAVVILSVKLLPGCAVVLGKMGT
jgi:hypothetical protein